MRSRLVPVLAVVLALAACQVVGPTDVLKPSAKRGSPEVMAPPTVAMAASPSSGPSGKPTSTAAPASAAPSRAMLHPPATGYHALAGAIQADAALLLASAGASVIANNSGNLISNNGGTLVSDHGAAVAVLAGGQVVSDNGGAVLVDAGGSLVASASGNAIPSDATGIQARQGGDLASSASGDLLPAGALVANNGGGLISNNGGTLTSKVKYRLAATDGGKPNPLAGMLVSAISLRTLQYLPVGVDDGGKPVYTVYSNLSGGYELYLPEDEAGNVMIVASVPGRPDLPFVLDTLTPVAAQNKVPLDPDTALATRIFRQIYVPHFAEMLVANPTEAAALAQQLGAVRGNTNALVTKPIAQLFLQLNAFARSKGAPQGLAYAHAPEVRALAQMMADVVLGYLDYDALQTSQLFTPSWQGSPEQPYEALGKAFAALRNATAAYMAAKGGKPPITLGFQVDYRTDPDWKAPACDGTATVTLNQPGDLGAYVVDKFLNGKMAHNIIDTHRAFWAVAIPPVAMADGDTPSTTNPDWYLDPANGKPLQQAARIDAAIAAVTGTIALTLAPPGQDAGAPPPPAYTAAIAILNAYITRHPFPSNPSPAPDDAPTCAPASPSPAVSASP